MISLSRTARLVARPRPGRVSVHRVGTAALLRALGGDTLTGLFVARLALAPGDLVTRGEFAEYVWGGDEDGGPLEVSDMMHIYMMKARRRGHVIENELGLGYRLVPPDEREERVA